MRAVVASFLLSGCLYSPHDYRGLACDADHVCPNDLACISNVCGGGPTSDNLLPNGGFESGTATWLASNSYSAFESQTTHVRTGQHAMRVFPQSTGSTLGLTLERTTVAATDGGFFCAEAFVDPGT